MLAFLGICAQAQVNTINGKLNTWFFWLNTAKISSKWNVSNEIHHRQTKPFTEKSTFILRPALNYQLNKSLVLSAGYSYIRNWPSGPRPAALPTTEHNVWQQVMLFHEIVGIRISHRFRQEERFIESIAITQEGAETGAYNFNNRFRYRLTATYPLFKLGGQQVDFTVFDELWINQLEGLRPRSFTRNWFYVGLDFHLDPKTIFHLGFMDQYDQIRAGSYIQQPIVQFMINTQLGDFSKTKNLELLP